MRMIGIGLMGVLLAAVALLLSTMNIVERGQGLVRQLATGPHLVFEPRQRVLAEGSHTADILRASPDHPVILSGFPAYQSVAFTFPRDARPVSGTLRVNATTQVLAGVEGVLRISIQNTRRGALLLRPGETERSLHIPLSPSDFAGDQLVVSFSLQGTDPQQQCGAEDGISAIVEIETTSALVLTLDAPLVSARDRVHAWGDVVRVAWPAWLKRDDQQRRLLLGVAAKRRGWAVQVVAAGDDHALSTVALRAALATLPGGPLLPDDPARAFDMRGAQAGLRRFYRSTAWRARYALTDGDRPRIPAHLDLRLALGTAPGGHPWLLSVTLNNRLLRQDSVEDGQRVYETRIDLPEDWQGADNQIEIVASTTAPRTGPCDQGPERIAELLAGTQLVPGAQVFAGPVDRLRAALADMGPLHVSVQAALTAGEAQQMVGWLAQTLPPTATLKPAGRRAQVVVAGPGGALPPDLASGPGWVLVQGRVAGRFDLRALAPGTPLPAGGVFVLIAPQGVDVGQGAS